MNSFVFPATFLHFWIKNTDKRYIHFVTLSQNLQPSLALLYHETFIKISLEICLCFQFNRYSLSTTPEAIGIMLCAFFPKFPFHSNDNRYCIILFMKTFHTFSWTMRQYSIKVGTKHSWCSVDPKSFKQWSFWQ